MQRDKNKKVNYAQKQLTEWNLVDFSNKVQL